MNVDPLAYPYRGVPLKPMIVQFLIRKLFSGKLVERQVLIDEVLSAHLAAGGLKASAESPTDTFKKALANMKEKGEAENTVPGYWRIHPAPESDSHILAIPEDSLMESDKESSATKPGTEMTADVELGSGPGAIYVYYLPTYRLRAEERNEKSWPCKIGRTDRDPLSRILSQAATALPERPHISLILWTSQTNAWEASIHGALTVRGLQLEDTPGVEWFLTSPEEILELIKSIDPRLAAYRNAHPDNPLNPSII
jgi:hypothetical protein